MRYTTIPKDRIRWEFIYCNKTENATVEDIANMFCGYSGMFHTNQHTPEDCRPIKNDGGGKKMAYGYKNLSKAQEDAIRIMKAHDNTLVKRDGFWTYENCEFHEYHNGSNLMKFPIYSCRFS